MDKAVSKYMSTIGRRGGLKSRRELDSETAKEMVRVREARRAFKIFHAMCFWSYNPEYQVTVRDIPWVAKQLMKHGDKNAWALGVKLCH